MIARLVHRQVHLGYLGDVGHDALGLDAARELRLATHEIHRRGSLEQNLGSIEARNLIAVDAQHHVPWPQFPLPEVQDLLTDFS